MDKVSVLLVCTESIELQYDEDYYDTNKDKQREQLGVSYLYFPFLSFNSVQA